MRLLWTRIEITSTNVLCKVEIRGREKRERQREKRERQREKRETERDNLRFVPGAFFKTSVFYSAPQLFLSGPFFFLFTNRIIFSLFFHKNQARNSGKYSGMKRNIS